MPHHHAIPDPIHWWIDATGGFHTESPSEDQLERVHASGVVDPQRRTGAIERFRHRRAVVGSLPHEIIDLLETRFPGTRWILADPAPAPEHADSV